MYCNLENTVHTVCAAKERREVISWGLGALSAAGGGERRYGRGGIGVGPISPISREVEQLYLEAEIAVGLQTLGA